MANRHSLPKPAFLIYALMRQLHILLRLTWLLLARARRPDTILMQTPPAIPAMAVCLLAARLRGARLAIDWHNYGYTILALRLGARHPAVRLARWWERLFGPRADLHFCVSSAMREDLADNWGIVDAVVLRDLPAARFRPAPPEERTRFLQALGAGMSGPAANALARPQHDRPAVLVSPTSWTVDEDFTLLFDALAACDAQMKKDEAVAGKRLYPDMVVFLTGRGPLRATYEQRAAALPQGRIHIVFAWLSADQYRDLLGAADIGLCLHTSSSGLDLPMKIADMQGAGLPVCAFDYGPCLAEMINPGETGLLFKNDKQLTEHICTLSRDFHLENTVLLPMRAAVEKRRHQTWSDGWAEVAAPLFGLVPSNNDTSHQVTR
jgi:beta-1,4-mannosyltransferase